MSQTATITTVKVEHIEQEIIHCIAREDMSEYGLVAGQSFDLVRSSTGEYYIVKDGVAGRECGCKGYSYRHTCKHVKAASDACKTRYFASKATQPGTLVLTPEQKREKFEQVCVTVREMEARWRKDDEQAHYQDSARSGELGPRAKVAELSRRAGFQFMA